MKSLLRIQRAVYQQPWMILPSMHENIRRQLEKHMAGPIPFDDMPMDDEEDDKEELIQNGNVVVIPVEGIIGKHLGMMETMCGGCDIDLVSQALDVAMADESITDVVMYFNTPGGTVTGVPEIAEKISEAAKKKRCIAYVDMLCASAGYYMASQCNAVYCAPSAELGSVGVYAIYLDESVALANAGIKVNAISAGAYKLSGASFKPMTDEERTMFQADVDKIYNAFKSAVTAKRDIKDEDLQGQVFDGEDAVMKGFADGNVNSLDELISMLSAGQQK